jgi:hypothetical protein
MPPSPPECHLRFQTNPQKPVCFVPLIPFSFKPYHDVSCHICHFHQDIGQRPDVQQQMNNPGSAPQQQHIPMQNGPPQGWGGQQKVQHPYYK